MIPRLRGRPRPWSRWSSTSSALAAPRRFTRNFSSRRPRHSQPSTSCACSGCTERWARLVGHFSAVEVASSPASRRLAEALRRVGAGPAAVRFYTEYVWADAVYEQVVRYEVVGGLLEGEPLLDADVVFGIRATAHLENRLAARLLDAWRTAEPPPSVIYLGDR
ncbi:iron-containing redox enzyme family protein [Streptomyces sp. NPDC001982]|uniref:iron-containing redox enzyme family protein n=1 Tax=Streptomyces sp. NPDC001982 TaxID=3154405 RepID=UPI0033195F89